jgi:hypothetical protein
LNSEQVLCSRTGTFRSHFVYKPDAQWLDDLFINVQISEDVLVVTRGVMLPVDWIAISDEALNIDGGNALCDVNSHICNSFTGYCSFLRGKFKHGSKHYEKF